jgi:PAP2 superfamily protein
MSDTEPARRAPEVVLTMSPMTSTSFLHRLDAHDRAIFGRWASDGSKTRWRRAWTALTHLGGATCTLLASIVPFARHGALRDAARLSLATLVGGSRVCLGVHYPGDVLAGQAIALATDWVVLAAP